MSKNELSSDVKTVLHGEFIEKRYVGLYEKIMKGRVYEPMDSSFYIKTIQKWMDSVK